MSATDAAGNVGTGSNNTALTVDKTAPVVSNFAASPSPAKQGTVVSVSFDVTDASAIPANPTVTVNTRTAVYASKTGNRYTYTYTIQAADTDGAAAIAVSAMDAADNVGTGSNNTVLTVDKAAPVISNFAATPSLAKQGTAVSVSFDVTDASAISPNPTVTVNTRAATFVSKSGNRYTYTYTIQAADADGAAAIAVSATDAAGNVGTGSNNTVLTVDKTPPVISGITAAPSCAKPGTVVSISFDVTDGSAIPANPTVTLFGRTGAYVSKTGNQYAYSFMIQPGDPEGPAAISVTAGDVAGNSRNVVDPTKLTIDKTSPVLANIAASPASAKLGTVITITFDASDALCGLNDNPTVSVNANPATYQSNSGSRYTYTYTTKPSDSEGPATISVTVVDLAGNSTTETDDTQLAIDLTAPSVTLKNTPSSLTNDVDVCATVSANDVNSADGLTMGWRAGLAGVVGTLSWNDAGSSTNASDQWIVRMNGLAAGTYQLQTKVVDEAGNEGTANHSWTIDLTAPTCTILTNGAAAVKGSAVFTVKFSEAVRDLEKAVFTVFPSGASVSTLTPVTPSNYTATVTSFGTTGFVGLALPARVCTDFAGNGNQAGALAQYKVDGVGPVIKNVSATPARVKTDASVTVVFDVVDDSALASVTVGGAAATGTAPRYTRTFSAGASGSVTINATDSLGNTATLTVPAAFVVDNAVPTFTWSGMPSGTTQSTSFNSTVGSIADGDSTLQYSWTLDGTPKQDWTYVPSSSSLTIAANGLADGEHTAVVKIRDRAGNEATQTKSWTVDTTGPTVQVTAGAQNGNGATFTVAFSDGTLATDALLLTTTEGLAAEIASITANNATNCTVAVTNLFGAGTATVTAPAGAVKDAAGNGSLNAASASLAVSWTKRTPVVSLSLIGRQLNASRLQWRLSSDQPLTGIAAGKFTVKRSGVSDADVAVDSVSTPATNAVITVTENDWGSEASHQPFMLIFDGSAVVNADGLAAGVVTNTAVESNLLIAKHGGVVADPFNTTPAQDVRIVDGVANGVQTDSASGPTSSQIVKYTFANSIVRKIGFTRTAGVNTISGATVTITRHDNTTFMTNFAFSSGQDHVFDIPDVVGKSVQFSNILPASSFIYINELAAMGCPVASDTVGPQARITLLDPAVTTAGTVRFLVACDEDNQLGAGFDWEDALDADGLTIGGISAVTTGYGRSYLVTLTGITGSGSVALSLPEGFFVDAIGNESPALISEPYQIDRTIVTAAFTLPVQDNTAATGGSVLYRVQFSEPVLGLAAADFTVDASNAAAQIHSIAAADGVDNAYDVLVSATWSDTATVSLSLAAGSVTDALGNPLAGGAASKTYRFEKPTENPGAVLVVVNAEANGTATPAGTNVVASGGNLNVVVTANEGYVIASLKNNDVPVPAAAGQATHTLALMSITSQTLVEATFVARADVTVTIVKTGNGTVTPASTFTVKYGGDASVAANATAGNRILWVKVGGTPRADAVGKTAYLVALPDLTANTSVDVKFETIPGVTVAATAGEGGTVSPGTQSVAFGGNATVTVTANEGHAIESVTVNGVAKPAAAGMASYTVSLFDLTADAAVDASFVECEQPPDNQIPFGDGSIWVVADAEHPVSFDLIAIGAQSASVLLGATMGFEPGAVPQPAYLLVQTELGSARTNTLEGTVDTTGTVEFDMPTGLETLFLIGIGNGDWNPLQR